MEDRLHWRVLDKARLLLVFLEELSGNAHVSFEGNLKNLALLRFPNVSSKETDSLRRNTRWPEQDFIVVPLEPSDCKRILNAIGGSVPRSILHIQIEKDGALQFGAYDNFHSEGIFFGPAIEKTLIESLITQGVISRL
jgi:hypothetical protein